MGTVWGKVRRDPLLYTVAAVFALLAPVPVFGNFAAYLASLFMIFALFSMGYNVLFGYAGLVSFGHSLFFAAGAYGVALFTLKLSGDPILGLLAGVSLSAVFAAAVGLLTLRHGRIYFAMLTLAFAMLFYALLFKWRDITGGSDGLAGIPRKSFLGDMTGLQAFYYFELAVFALSVTLLYLLERSNVGLVVKALGNDEELVEFVGHSAMRYRMIAFLISSVVSGVAGSLYALLVRVVTPELAYWTMAAVPLIITLIGGASHFAGPLIGALIYVVVTTAAASLADVWQLILGLFLAAVLLGFRGGVLGVMARLWEGRR